MTRSIIRSLAPFIQRATRLLGVILVLGVFLISQETAHAAIASPGTLGAVSSKTANQSTLVLTTTAIAEAGNIIIVTVAKDNATTTDSSDYSSDISSITDSAGNTYTHAHSYTNGRGSTQAGAMVSVWYTKVTSQLNSGGTITANFLNNTLADATAISAREFTVASGNTIAVQTATELTNNNQDPGSMTISSLASQEWLFFRGIAAETNNSTLTQTSGYTIISGANTTGAAEASNMSVTGEYRILTATASTSDPTLGDTSNDNASVFIAFKEVAVITLSGIISQADESTAHNCSSGGPYTVKVTVDGSGSFSGDCTLSTGAWSVPNIIASAGQTIYVFLDNEAVVGSTVLVSNGVAQTDVPIYINRVILRDDGNGIITNAEILAGNTADADDLISFSGSNMTVAAAYETHIVTGDKYVPGANISTGSFHRAGTFDLGSNTLTLTGTSGTLFSGSNTFTQGTSTISVTSASGTPQLFSTATTIYNLTINSAATVINAGATPTFDTNGSLTVTSGVINFDTGVTGPGASGTLTIESSGTICLGGTAAATNVSATCNTGATSTTAVTMPTFNSYSTTDDSTIRFLSDADLTVSTPDFPVVFLTPTLTAARTYTLESPNVSELTVDPTAATSLALTVNLTDTFSAMEQATLSGTGSGTSILDLRPAGTSYDFRANRLNIAAAGTLDASGGSSTITFIGTSGTQFTRTGSFIAGTSKVEYIGNDNVTLTSGTFTGGNAFYNLSITPDVSSSVAHTFGSGAIEVTSDLTIQPSGTQQLTVNMVGNLAVTDTTAITRSETATSSLATGASNPTFSTGDLNIATGGTLNGTSSSSVITLTENGTPFVRTGTYTPGSTTMAYVPTGTSGVTVTSGSYYNITFNKSSNTFSLAASGITATNDLTITAGVLDTVSGSNYPITVGRHWTNTPGSGGFLAQNGTVTFNTTTTANITGTTTFHNFTAATAGKTLKFGDATTFTINGLFTLTGSAGPSYVTLDSVTGGSTQWTINHQGTESISYASVKNSACDGSSTQISAVDGTSFNAGNNGSCWTFVSASITESVHWPMDEATGSTLNDRTGHNIVGTLGASTAAPAWQTPDQCIANSCLYFDGSDDVVTASVTDDVNSVSFWIRPMSTTTTILQLTNSAYISASSGTLSATGFSNPTFYVNGQPSKTIIAGSWQHITVTTSSTIEADAIILGNNSTNYFKGFMDEVKFFPEALTAAQVKGQYVALGSTDAVSARFGENPSTLTQGLVGWWKMDESSDGSGATTRVDSSGYGNHLTDINTTASGQGKYWNGADFENDNNEALVIAHASQVGLNPTEQVTASVWAKVESNSSGQNWTIISKAEANCCGTDNSFAYSLFLTSGNFPRFGISTNGLSYTVANGPSALSNGVWYHLTGTFDGSHVKLYINGALVGTTPLVGTIHASTGDFLIGAIDGGNNGDQYLSNADGLIDEARVYNRALSTAEVSELYNWAPGPITYLSLDENTGTSSLSDSSGNGNSGTLNNMEEADWTPGRYGASLLLNEPFGSGDEHITVANENTFDFDTGSFTVSTFFKHADHSLAANPSTLASKKCVGTSCTTAAGFRLYMPQASNNICFAIDDNITNESICGGSYGDNVWHHVSAVKNGTSGIHLYVDGILIASDTSLTTTSSLNNDVNVRLGNVTVSGFGTIAPWAGYIDEFKIYNYARTPSQIMEDMNGSSIPVPIAHWKFDEMSGTSANDSSTNANHLTLSAASWTTSGKFQGAWNGTGSIWLSRADDPDLNFSASQDFSLSGWFKSDSASNPGADQFLIDKQANGNNAGYRLYFNTSGQVVCDIDDDTTSYPEDSATTTADYYDGAWHNIICIRNITTNTLDLYIDGVRVAQDSSLSATGSLTNTAVFYIGDDDGDATNSFAGDIDEVKVYRMALTAKQVLMEYNGGKSALLGNTSTASNGITPDNSKTREYCVPGDTSTCNPPVGEWKLDEGSGTSAFDTSGNGSTAALQNGPTWTQGKFGNAINFDGDDDRLDTGLTTNLTGELTISTWVYLTTTNCVFSICSILDKSRAFTFEPEIGLFYHSSNNTIAFRRGFSSANGRWIVPTTLPLNAWHHIAVTYNSSSSANDPVMYINGTSLTVIEADTPSGTARSESTSFLVGDNRGGDLPWFGRIDDLKIYNYIRTPAQIAWEYNRGAPIAHYKLDECSGTTANNSATNGNGDPVGMNGTITIGNSGTNNEAGTCDGDAADAWANGASGKRNGSLSFDGLDDYVEVSSASYFDVGAADDLSISAWVYLDVATDDQTIVARKTSQASTDAGYMLFFNDPADIFQFNISDGTDQFIISSNVAPTGQWAHVVAVFDQDSAANSVIYINGINQKSSSTGAIGNVDAVAPAVALRIGTQVNGSADFDGLIDDVQIFNYALSSLQVKTLMNSGAVRFE